MPGHLIEAVCACGFMKGWLAPGVDERLVEYGIAYTESGSDLDTFEVSEIASRKLNELSNPFLEEPEPKASLEEWDRYFKRRLEPQGPYHCPKCQQNSLAFHFQGNWD
jgi:hypothetical protein